MSTRISVLDYAYLAISWFNVLVSPSKPVFWEAKPCCSPEHRGDPIPFHTVPSDLGYFLSQFFSLPLPASSFPPSRRKTTQPGALLLQTAVKHYVLRLPSNLTRF